MINLIKLWELYFNNDNVEYTVFKFEYLIK
jgi:hypothetical protein